jgi:hypothetical protein
VPAFASNPWQTGLEINAETTLNPADLHPTASNANHITDWRDSVKNIDDAHKRINNPYTTYIKLGFDKPLTLSNAQDSSTRANGNASTDDFHDASQRESDYANRMFDMILHMPTSAKPKAKDSESWMEACKVQLDLCKSWTDSEEKKKDILASCFVAVNMAVKLHEKGVPEHHVLKDASDHLVLTKRHIKLKDPNWTVDRTIKCSNRIEKMIEVVKTNK